MKLLKTIVVLLAGTTLTTATALAQQVGTATAVNPESRTTPPGGSTVVLKSAPMSCTRNVSRRRRQALFSSCFSIAVRSPSHPTATS